jgi:Zn-dependent hydrolases, including glyoxylases
MKVIRFPAGVYQANCYIVYNEITNEGFIIDPGGDSGEILSLIKNNKISIKFIILTHGHFDHIGGVKELKQELGAHVYIHQGDSTLISDKSSPLKPFAADTDVFEADKYVKDEDTFYFGNESIIIYETPGHTPGGISIKSGDSVFTGDTLFNGSIGRTDFPGGSFAQLIRSIKEKLLVLPDDTTVYPGHGPETNIGSERVYNPFLQ